jgi:hypothetical protein
MATPFESTLVRISHIAQATFSKLGSPITDAFSQIAPAVTRFAENIGRGLSRLGPTISGIASSFTPLLDALGSRMPTLINTFGDSLRRIADSASPEFVVLLVDAFEFLIIAVTDVITMLTHAGNAIGWVWDKFKLFTGLGKLWGEGAEGADEFGGAVDSAGESADGAASAVGRLKDQITELANNALASSEAAIGLEEAIDRAGEAAKKNGRNLDINTEKGRANRSALNGIARAALQMRDAMERNGEDTGRAMDRARAAFIRTARQMGYTKGEAGRLADQFGLVRTAVVRIPGSKTVRVRQNGIGDAIRASHQLNSAIRNIPRDWVTYHRVMRIGDSIRASKEMGMAHGGIVGAAGGGPRSAMTLVGEQGPELVTLPFGSTVHPNGQSMNMLAGMAGGGGGGPIDITLVLDGRVLAKAMFDPLRGEVGKRGGVDRAFASKRGL